jgi:alpha-galactosidase
MDSAEETMDTLPIQIASAHDRRTTFRSTLVLLCLFAASVCAFGDEALQPGQDFAFGECYAHFTGTELTLGNAHIRRKWKVEHGRLFATSYFDLDSNVEWIGAPPALASPTLPAGVVEGTSTMRGASAAFGPTEARSLRVELETAGQDATVDYEFQIFPDATGVRQWLTVKGTSAWHPEPAAATRPDAQPVGDAIERLQITKAHLRLTQVTLKDRTDQHNELVFKDQWLLHPNEALLELPGNIFVMEDTLTGDGLVFLKEAPQPEMRPVKNDFDLWFSGAAMVVPEKSDTVPATYSKLSFYGNGFTGSGEGYRSVLLAYHGGREGRIAALQSYQRQIRQYVPDRDGLLLSNTWGDRSFEAKLNERFIHKEIDAGKKLGVDVVQIDGGWQLGKTQGLQGSGGVWESFWKTDPHFWDPSPERFPKGFTSLADYAHANGMKLGLWFAPDSYDDFANWQRDADQLLTWNREEHVDAFKLDAVKIRSKQGESNYHALVDRVLDRSSGKILLDLDVTAETRQGYFGNIAAGPLFVENRYTDMHRYWPHQTLRNLWKLSQYVEPIRLRIEFLNSDRNTRLYPDDPLAPNRYDSSCLFAITMFASPLAWFENSGLSPQYVADAAPLIAEWKKQRETIYRETTVPIGEAPDGIVWTGFASVAAQHRGGYLLLFRELSEEPSWTVPASLFAPGQYRVTVLGGKGSVVQTSEGFRATVPARLGFVWVKLEPRQ